MSRRVHIIQFPTERTSEGRERQLQADVEKRVEKLPKSLRELDVAWIFKAAATRLS